MEPSPPRAQSLEPFSRRFEARGLSAVHCVLMLKKKRGLVPDRRSYSMTTTEQPAPRPIIPARLAELLQRAMSWRPGAGVAAPKPAMTQDALEADTGACDRAELPWWVAHHPAVSFRGPRMEENRD